MQIDVAKHIGNVTNGDLRALRNRKLIRVSDGNCGFAERLNLRINATRILSGNRPLRTLERMARAAIIVGQRIRARQACTTPCHPVQGRTGLHGPHCVRRYSSGPR